MTRNTLGKALGKRLRISAVSILNYDGAEEMYKEIVQLVLQGRKDWRIAQKSIKKANKARDSGSTSEATAVGETDTINPSETEGEGEEEGEGEGRDSPLPQGESPSIQEEAGNETASDDAMPPSLIQS